MERYGPPPNTFDRSLLIDAHHKTLIRSICKRCGKVILGSVTTGLPRQEKEHLDRCAKAAAYSEPEPHSAALQGLIERAQPPPLRVAVCP